MGKLKENLVYEEKLDQLSGQMEESILDAMLSALEKLNERREPFLRLELEMQKQASGIKF